MQVQYEQSLPYSLPEEGRSIFSLWRGTKGEDIFDMRVHYEQPLPYSLPKEGRSLFSPTGEGQGGGKQETPPFPKGSYIWPFSLSETSPGSKERERIRPKADSISFGI